MKNENNVCSLGLARRSRRHFPAIFPGIFRLLLVLVACSLNGRDMSDILCLSQLRLCYYCQIVLLMPLRCFSPSATAFIIYYLCYYCLYLLLLLKLLQLSLIVLMLLLLFYYYFTTILSSFTLCTTQLLKYYLVLFCLLP